MADNMVRESSRREQVDIALGAALKVAYKTYEEVCTLQGMLVGAGAASTQPRLERPARSGWLGEVQDRLGELNDFQEDTSNVLRDISSQLGTQTPTPIQIKVGR